MATLKEDYVIKIQWYQNDKSQFTPKEVSVLSLQSNTIGHWVVKPNINYTALPNHIKENNRRFTQDWHGLEWYDGYIHKDQMKYLLL